MADNAKFNHIMEDANPILPAVEPDVEPAQENIQNVNTNEQVEARVTENEESAQDVDPDE